MQNKKCRKLEFFYDVFLYNVDEKNSHFDGFYICEKEERKTL